VVVFWYILRTVLVKCVGEIILRSLFPIILFVEVNQRLLHNLRRADMFLYYNIYVFPGAV
jgi:hypothetical protein